MSVETTAPARPRSAEAGAPTGKTDSLKATARLAGVLYFTMAILDVFGYMYFPSKFMVPGDAAATARGILDHELLYRTSILTALAGSCPSSSG